MKSLGLQGKLCVVTHPQDPIALTLATSFLEAGSSDLALLSPPNPPSRSATTRQTPGDQLRSLARSKGWKDAKIVDMPLPCTPSTFKGLDATKRKLGEAFPGRPIDVLCCGPPTDEADAVRSTPLLHALADSMSASSEAKDAYSLPSRNASIILISTPYGPRVDLPQPQLPLSGAKSGEKPGAAEMSRLSGVLAAEYARKGVRVNCIAPGFVKTPVTAALLEADPSLARSWQDATPLGRLGGVEELKGAAVLFASDASRFTSMAGIGGRESTDTEERTPLLAPPPLSTDSPTPSSPTGSAATLSPSASRPSYRQRALSRASGNPLPLAAGSTDDDPAVLAEAEAEVALARRRARRRIWAKRILLGVLGFVLLAGIVLSIVLPLTVGRRGRGGGGGGEGGKKKKDTPDMTHLPPPRPGARNPSYMVSGWNGAVASEEERCSRMGVDVLRENGTAVDAAITTALCIGVVNSFSSGIGGGGFMVIRPPSSSRHGLPSTYDASQSPRCAHPVSIDFRETAPLASHPDMFTSSARPDDRSWDPNRASKVGGLAVGVPGELRGFQAAYEACGGGVSWERIFRPVAQLAREFKVGKELHRRLNARWTGGQEGPTISEWMKEEEDWRAMFMRPGGNDFLQEGDIVRREAYARTLEKLGKEGADVFYDGEIADRIVETVRKEGGILSKQDMRDYKAVVRRAEEGTYRGRRYYTGSYPSGGPIIRMLLNVLDGYADFVDGGRTGVSEHRFIEALKFAFAARTNVGDPPFIDNAAKLAEIPTRKYADAVRGNITDDRTHKLSYYQPRFDIKEDHGTTHLAVIDQWGGAVSLTTTVNLIFGSRVMDKETGIILNDEMDDFATPGLPDAFGLRPSPFNYPAGGKRPLSSTSPLIMDHVNSDDVYLSLGGSGGSRIFGAVAQTLLNLDWGHDLSSAVEAPRVHHQLLPAYVSIESTFRPDLVKELKARGHDVTLFDINIGIAEVQAVMRDRDGRFFAASDSRKNGVPAAY
ncbi:hypothetical protein JCM10295v2_005087 [Rhodotorula toruloides]